MTGQRDRGQQQAEVVTRQMADQSERAEQATWLLVLQLCNTTPSWDDSEAWIERWGTTLVVPP